MSDLVDRLRKSNGWDLVSIVHEAADRIEQLERVLAQARETIDPAISAARLLGVTQAKQGFGVYTEEDARFETAMHQAIAKHRRIIAAIDEALNAELSGAARRADYA